MSADTEEQAVEASRPLARDGRRGERRSRPRFHLPERRTGFDRRRSYPVTGSLRDRPLLLLAVLVVVNALSALDFALTYIQLQAGVAQEANPVLAKMFAETPGRAWLFKTGVMLAVSIVIWQQRKHRAVLGVAVCALVFYALLLGYHLLGMHYSGLL